MTCLLRYRILRAGSAAGTVLHKSTSGRTCSNGRLWPPFESGGWPLRLGYAIGNILSLKHNHFVT